MTKREVMFASLHNHTEYSLLDGHSRVKELVQQAKELGMPALAITDHGNMFGAVEFFKECKKQGVKPIIGCEVYQAPKSMLDKTPEDRKPGHLVLLCKNKTGYHNLIKIVSDAYKNGMYYGKPRTDKEYLKTHSEGLICLSGCLVGFVQQKLLNGLYEEAKAEALELQEIFGKENFFLEVQEHGTEDDAKLLPRLKKLGEDTGIPFCATNDSHYVKKEDAEAQDILLCINTQASVSATDRMSFPNSEFYLKSGKEMHNLLSQFPGACENTVKIADECNFEFEFGHYHVPSFPVPSPFADAKLYFEHLCEVGFQRRYPDADEELRSRLSYEINTIENMGYVEYFLIVWDYINYAKSHGVSVGPGRGSAAGSVVAYSLGITDIDPIQYSLIFERFLNPERVSMPDIDTDFCIINRGSVIDYVAEKYGQDSVCQIVTFGRLKAKAAIKNVAKAYDMPYAQSNTLSKLISNDPKMTIGKALEESPDFKAQYESDSLTRKIVDMAMKVEGRASHISTHAAGVVIASQNVDAFVPLVQTEKGIATQFTMTEIEELGLLKYDFLGLRNLTAIEKCKELIFDSKGVSIDFDNMSMDDPKVFEMISQGGTTGVFQLESKGITGFMKDLKPTCFEDIVAGIALYRPGPMDSIPQYIENKKHPDRIMYVDPHLAPILSVTYGVTVYQEQVMQIVRDLAGYSFGRSDLVRRAMSKKKLDVMMEEKEYFINGKLNENGDIEIPGCVRNGIPADAAEKIFDDMTSFASYAFNKSHAAAYAVITYRTAWLRCYYPAEFFAALMSTEAGNHEHLAIYINDARRIMKPGTNEKINVLRPSIINSKADFSVTENGDIRFGLAGISGVGQEAALGIEQMSKENMNNLHECFNRKPMNTFSSKTIEGLAKAGVFKDFDLNIATVLRDYESILKDARNNAQNEGQLTMGDLFDDFNKQVFKDITPAPELSDSELLTYEKEALGVYISGHPLEKYQNLIDAHTTASASDISNGIATGNVTLAGLITSKKQIVTKKGDLMAFLEVEDGIGTFEMTVFPRLYAECSAFLGEGHIIAIVGNVDKEQVLAEKIIPIEDLAAINPGCKKVWIKCKNTELCHNLLNTYGKAINETGTDEIIFFDAATRKTYKKGSVNITESMIGSLKRVVGENNIVSK